MLHSVIRTILTDQLDTKATQVLKRRLTYTEIARYFNRNKYELDRIVERAVNEMESTIDEYLKNLSS